MRTLPHTGDETQLVAALNADLKAARLICEADACPVVSMLGFVGDVTLTRLDAFLLLKTGVGIECGHDESAYLFEWTTKGWHRFWETEQNQYNEDAYKPQRLEKVLITTAGRSSDYLILTLGAMPWCTSTWHDVYFRVFRPGSTVNPKPLFEGEEYAWLGKELQGSATPGNVLVEYSVGSLDPAVHSRTVVRKYSTGRGRLQRIDPIALSPRDFVEEWLSRDWPEVKSWTEARNRPRLQTSHTKLHGTGTFEPTLRCPGTPELWQVGITFQSEQSPAYFLVRWRRPYHFRLVDITTKANVGCTEPDRAADEGHFTLFPPQ